MLAHVGVEYHVNDEIPEFAIISLLHVIKDVAVAVFAYQPARERQNISMYQEDEDEKTSSPFTKEFTKIQCVHKGKVAVLI